MSGEVIPWAPNQEAIILRPRTLPRRLAVVLLGVVCVATLGGCAWDKNIRFTNVSTSWVQVRFYVRDKGTSPQSSAELVGRRTVRIAPGGSASYVPYRANLVHVQVEPVTASWQPSGRQYWLELLREPPVNIVALGSSNKLTFETGPDTVAIIPDREITGGRYHYTIVDTSRQNSN